MNPVLVLADVIAVAVFAASHRRGKRSNSTSVRSADHHNASQSISLHVAIAYEIPISTPNEFEANSMTIRNAGEQEPNAED